MNIFKTEYYWYEGDYGETLLAKDTAKEQFEKDLIEAKNFAESLKGKEIKEGSYLGNGYRIECLPEFYEQIIWFLINKKSYSECKYDNSEEYYVDDGPNKEIDIQKRVQKFVWEDIKDEKDKE